MDNLAVYQNEAHKENVFQIHEKTEQYQGLLDEATARFNAELANIEQRYQDHSENPETIYKAMERVIANMSKICEEFEQGIGDKALIKEARIEFRKKTNPIMSKSYLVNRARIWPQGYQGDHKTLEGIYRNIPLSEGIGYYLDMYFLNVTLAEAVRNRIKKLEEILRNEIKQRSEPAILNLACGSCREFMRIVPEISASKAKVICVDNDNDALAFAQDRLSYTGILPQIEFRKYNTIRMFDHELNMMEFGPQDIIYSIGHFDYLDDDFLVKMLHSLYALLKPGGKLIAAFKDANRYESQPYHWLVDWDGFLQRNKEDFDRLFDRAGIPDSALSITREKSGVIIFYTATK